MAREMLWTSVVCWLGLAAAAAGAESPESQFQKLYGDDASKAAKSPSSKESIAFAAKLLEDAGALKSDPDMARLLLEKAYELGCKSAPGCATAIQAARIRREQDPADKEHWQEKLLSACRIQYQKSNGPDKAQAADTLIVELMNVSDALNEKGDLAEAAKPLQECRQAAAAVKSPRLDDITDRLKTLNGKIDVQKKFSAYARKLVDNPQDAATAKAMVLLCVVQLDDPSKAASYAEATGDDTLKKMVPLAAEDVTKISEENAGELAEWYQTLAKKADRPGKIAVLTRARKCYEKILAKHTGDAQGIKLRRELDELAKELAALTQAGRELVLDLGKGVKMKFVRIPAGEFVMGDEEVKGSAHPVAISRPFYMGVTLVTQEQYEQITGKKSGEFAGAQNPVEQVSWDDAVAFCKKLSTKAATTVELPTEAQWEYACRAGSKGKYCFGDDRKLLGDYAWYADNSNQKTHPVAQKKPNAWGLYDMHGNVWEWCGDWYAQSYDAAKKTDPTGPASGSSRVLRGGSWYGDANYCRCGSRYDSDPQNTRNRLIGFRVAVASK